MCWEPRAGAAQEEGEQSLKIYRITPGNDSGADFTQGAGWWNNLCLNSSLKSFQVPAGDMFWGQNWEQVFCPSSGWQEERSVPAVGQEPGLSSVLTINETSFGQRHSSHWNFPWLPVTGALNNSHF